MKLAIALLLSAASAATAQSISVGPNTISGETREQKLMFINSALTKAELLAAAGEQAGFETLAHYRDHILTVQELRSNARKLRVFADFEAAAPY